MDVYVFRFSAKQLKAIDQRALSFLIASAHCCNEFVALMPYIVFEHSLKNANEVEEAFILVRRFTIDRIVVSKIVEYGELCDKFCEEIRDLSEEWATQIRANYDGIRKKIRSAKWARILRNKTSFHYDRKHALESVIRLPDEHPLRLLAGRMKGVTLYDFAEEVVSRPIFEAAGNGDIGKGMTASNKFLVDLVSEITTFHAEATKLLFKVSNLVSVRDKKELRDEYCGVPRRRRIPLSISSKYASERQRKKARTGT